MKTNNKSIHNNTLRSIFSLSLVLLMFFIGCDQFSDVTSPISESSDKQLKVKSDLSLSVDSDNRDPYLHREDTYPPGADSIFVPLKLPGSEIPNLIVSQVIDGNVGDKIDIDHEFQTVQGDTISILAQLIIHKDAFDGVEEITVMLNNEMGIITFYPHIVFNDPVKFKLTYTGLDLSEIDPDSIDFIFQNYDGTIEQVGFESISIIVSTGKLEVKGSRLAHFSRYGFVN